MDLLEYMITENPEALEEDMPGISEIIKSINKDELYKGECSYRGTRAPFYGTKGDSAAIVPIPLEWFSGELKEHPYIVVLTRQDPREINLPKSIPSVSMIVYPVDYHKNINMIKCIFVSFQ